MHRDHGKIARSIQEPGLVCIDLKRDLQNMTGIWIAKKMRYTRSLFLFQIETAISQDFSLSLHGIRRPIAMRPRCKTEANTNRRHTVLCIALET